jgi:hypothetical protein
LKLPELLGETSTQLADETPVAAFILSDMRSGSTLLDQLLGAHTDILSVGELHWLAAYATQDRGQYNPDHELVCACGLAVSECPFWTGVEGCLGRGLAAMQLRPAFAHGIERLLGRLPALFRVRVAQTLFAGRHMVPDSLALVDCLSRVSGRRHVVDASKSPFRFRAIYEARPARVRAILLTRDYRAVVHSKMKRGHTLDAAATGWRSRMRQIAALTDDLPKCHVHRMTYEDLCRDPSAELARLCRFLGVTFEPRMLQRPNAGLHHIGGSPSKFDRSRTEIVLDTSYQNAFTASQLARLRRLVGDIPERWGY